MVFPLYDNNPFAFKSPPYVSWGLIAANVAIFLYTLSVDASGSNSKTAVVLALAFTPADVGHHTGILPYFVPWEFTLVSYAFLHASWLHIIGNMAFLWVFGDDVEEALGHLRFFLFYLLCAAAGAFAFWASTPYSIVLAFMRIPVKLAAEWVIGFWIVLQFINIFAGADKEVAWWTHIGGLMAGALLVVFMRRPGVKLFDCDADRLLQNQNSPPLKHWPKRVDS